MSKIKVKCDNCGKSIERIPYRIKRSKHHFCNIKCQGEWQSKNIKGEKSPTYKGGKVKVRCAICGKSIERAPSKVKIAKNHFCRECFKQERKAKKVEVRCDNCGKIIEKEPNEIRRTKLHFCNSKCWGGWISKNRSGGKSPNYRKVGVKCDNCGDIILKPPVELKRRKIKHHFCNKKCEGQWRATDKVWGEHLKKIGSNIRSPTKPELFFKEICERNNLPFHYVGDGQIWIGKKGEKQLNPDFVEGNGKKIAVEIFSYWHDPLRRHCKVPYSQTYKGRKKILKKYGWKLVVFWQEDLEREDAEQFILNKLKQEKAI